VSLAVADLMVGVVVLPFSSAKEVLLPNPPPPGGGADPGKVLRQGL